VEIGIGLPNAIPCIEGETMLARAREAGCDELLLVPCSGDLKQLELLRGCVDV
jgi:hypothetical protein